MQTCFHEEQKYFSEQLKRKFIAKTQPFPLQLQGANPRVLLGPAESLRRALVSHFGSNCKQHPTIRNHQSLFFSDLVSFSLAFAFESSEPQKPTNWIGRPKGMARGHFRKGKFRCKSRMCRAQPRYETRICMTYYIKYKYVYIYIHTRQYFNTQHTAIYIYISKSSM